MLADLEVRVDGESIWPHHYASDDSASDIVNPDPSSIPRSSLLPFCPEARHRGSCLGVGPGSFAGEGRRKVHFSG